MPLGSFKKFFSSWVGILILIIIILGLGFLSSSLFVKEEDKAKDNNTTTDTSQTNPLDTTTPAVENKATDTNPTTSPTEGWLTFDKADFGFSFKYPKDWTIQSATNEKNADNPISSQKTVQLKSPKGDIYELDNPIATASFEGATLENKKEIKSSSVTFVRLYGPNKSKGQELYTATYQDPNNVDDLSVVFFGLSSTLDATSLGILDNLVSTFKFI